MVERGRGKTINKRDDVHYSKKILDWLGGLSGAMRIFHNTDED